MSLPVVTESIQSYLADVSRFPVLSAEEEFRVAERYYRLKRMDDAHTLVTSNLRYVVKIALEFRRYGCRLADLVQEGNIGLMVAVKKFNPHKGFRLITYATWWIRSFIQEFVLKSTGIVKRGTKALKKKLFYRNAGDSGAGPTNDLSLNASLTDDAASHVDMLADEGPTPVDAVAAMEETALVKKEVTGALGGLNEKERQVIEKRMLADEPQSLQEIGSTLGLTRERVRQIEAAALKKLKDALGQRPSLAAVLG